MLFGRAHLLALVVCGVAMLLLYQLGRRLRHARRLGSVAFVLGLILIGLEALKAWEGYAVAAEPWQELLPLHMCRIGSFICCAMLWLRNYRLFEVAYFWGIGGSLAALLTPDLQQGFPHFRFFGFFGGHSLVLASVLFAIRAFEFRPRLRSIAVVAWVTLVYMALVSGVNILLDTNYLFLSHKPEAATIYDYLGPWPWYIASVWGIGVVVALLLYTPFAFKQRPS